jgi:5-methylcytosine-specific restriction enzyme subunit McrC
VSIPIRNVYYLLLYAWDRVGEGEEALVGGEDLTRWQDLLGHVLAGSVARLLSRGLDRSYLELDEEVAGVRGKLQLAGTIKGNLLLRARTRCRFDEPEYDVLQNRIIKATLRSLLAGELSREVRDHVRALHAKLDAVSDVRITRRDFGSVQLHRNNHLYAFVLDLCRLIHDNLLVDENGTVARFRDFREDDPAMAAVFERFVFNFLDREQRRYRVARPRIPWHEAEAPQGGLPGMQTDVVLRGPERVLILDAKYYREALAGRFDERVRSGHLYQMFAYVENWAAARPDGPPVEAMLLYPVVRRIFAYDFTVRSIDLNQEWSGILADLLRLVGC